MTELMEMPNSGGMMRGWGTPLVATSSSALELPESGRLRRSSLARGAFASDAQSAPPPVLSLPPRCRLLPAPVKSDTPSDVLH